MRKSGLKDGVPQEVAKIRSNQIFELRKRYRKSKHCVRYQIQLCSYKESCENEFFFCSGHSVFGSSCVWCGLTLYRLPALWKCKRNGENRRLYVLFTFPCATASKKYCQKQINARQRLKKWVHRITFTVTTALLKALFMVYVRLFCLAVKWHKTLVRTLTNCTLLPALTLG